MKEPRAVRKPVIAWVVGIALALGVGAPALAQSLPAFRMIGLAEGQFASLNVVLVDPPDENHPGCRVTAAFVDAVGKVIYDVRGIPAKRTFTLQPQIATALKLYSEYILAPGQLRRSIRAVLTPAPNAATPSRCGCVASSVDVVNPDGRTVTTDFGLGDAAQICPGGGNPPSPPGGGDPIGPIGP